MGDADGSRAPRWLRPFAEPALFSPTRAKRSLRYRLSARIVALDVTAPALPPIRYRADRERPARRGSAHGV